MTIEKDLLDMHGWMY